MSREIKGRSWDGRRMVYWDTLEIDFLPDHTPIIRFKHDTFCGKVRLTSHEDMLFTGLRDGNGNEIYEGDILDKKYRWVVRFRDGIYMAEAQLNGTMNTDYLCKVIMERKKAGIPVEVIGNIYENEELLKETA